MSKKKRISYANQVGGGTTHRSIKKARKRKSTPLSRPPGGKRP